jgi:signal transduction histidine kinase
MVLAAFNQVNDEFKHVSLVSQQGRIIASTRWNDDTQFALDEKLLQKLLAGQGNYANIQFTDNEFPQIHMAVMLPEFSKTMGLVWAVLDLKFVWDVLEGISIGKSGQVYIVDANGKYIGHRHIDKVLTTVSQVPESTLKQIRGTGTPMQWFEDEQDTRYYCLGIWLPQMDWIIALRQPYKEIYLHLFRNLYWAALITFVACVVAILFGFYRVRNFLAPIRIMHRQVRQIGQGDLERKVTVTSSHEIGELAEAFNEMADSLKDHISKEIHSARQLAHAQDLAMLGVSAGKVTHEVGNLLNNVGMAANLLHSESLSPGGTTALSKMEKESDRVRAFIQKFLQFAKPTELQLKPVALDLIIQEAMAMHETLVKEQGIKMIFEWPANAPQVQVDTQLIYQLFDNLIKNSTGAMKRPGTLDIVGTVDGAYLQIKVKDTGEGIAPEHIDRIFDPFFSTKGKKGTGLGLAIVKSTITAHRGTINCQSEPGKGTSITIRLPIK